MPIARAPRSTALRARRGDGLHARHRHHAPCRRAAAGAGVGREGRHRHQFRNAGSRASGRSCAAPGEVRADWRIICDVATRMGYAGFDYASAAEVFREHAELSRLRERRPARFRHLGGWLTLDDGAYDALAPVQWPVTSERSGRHGADVRRRQTFFTPDRKARFVPVAPRAPRARHQPRAFRWCSTPAVSAISGTP